MKRRKRTICAAILMGMAIGLWGCGNAAEPEVTPEESALDESQASGENQENAQNQENTESSGAQTAEGYFFEANGVVIGVDMNMDDLLDSLGEYKSVFEAPSCAGEGMSYLYTYASYEIETYPSAEGENLIGYIVLKDDTVATREGVDLSMTREDVIRVYGEDYQEAPNAITYEKNGTKLNFILEGDAIVSIEYVSPVVG